MSFDTALSICLSVCVFIFFFAVFMLIRNNWVYKQRYRVLGPIDECFEGIERAQESLWAYHQLPDYNTMFYRFWSWRLLDFVPKESTERFRSYMLYRVGQEAIRRMVKA